MPMARPASRTSIPRTRRRQIDLSFFMTNVTDRTYGLGGFEVYRSVGTSSLVYNEPRMFGFRMRYRFGAEAGKAEEPAATTYAPPPVQAPAPAAPHSYL